MRLDADDRISARLAGFVNSAPTRPAWNLRSAYSYVLGRSYLHEFDDWVEHAILNTSVLQFPSAGHEPPDPDCLFTRWGHQQMTNALACRRNRDVYIALPRRMLRTPCTIAVELQTPEPHSTKDRQSTADHRASSPHPDTVDCFDSRRVRALRRELPYGQSGIRYCPSGRSSAYS